MHGRSDASLAGSQADRREVWPGALLTSPVLASVAPWAARLARFPRFPAVSELDATLRDRLAIEPGVALEPQVKTRRRRGPVDRDALYEVRIHVHRRVPTRERSWHDLTNALVWAAFPRSKRALTARQLAILDAVLPRDAARLPSARTREQDALAMLDEGGIVVLVTHAHHGDATRAHEGGDEDALRQLRDGGHAAPLVFGHAMMEHALEGTLDVRGYGVVLGVDALPETLEARVDLADRVLAAWIARTDELLRPSPWRGLSLAGVVA
ncbi:DUF3025 domain-containing protein [Sandaracinus amylolyticus]|uniref:DUF3025 domain-containing protein n=1 Tax=Sandaracinus amylolyticus TaxID=927083 RepID=UPI001F2B311E|nr:DUF3025 domain-containing protein [Sandaracinus amylolyticus]UJR83333.1 Hypothetical protein I5071_54010 [Sandaracinus amylolyticus]